MLVKKLIDCDEFIAGDGSILSELLHPDKANIEIRYSLAYAKVSIGQKTTPHILRTSEVYYILSGSGCMHINNESCTVSSHCSIYIPPGATQFIVNTGKCELEFLCIVDPAWRKSDEIVIER